MDENPNFTGAYERGAAEARADIAAGHLRVKYFAPGEWGRYVIETLRDRFGAEHIPTTCFVTQESLAYDKGYESEVNAHIECTWGPGAWAAFTADMQHYRDEVYKRARKNPN
jgi:hypothetical protein